MRRGFYTARLRPAGLRPLGRRELGELALRLLAQVEPLACGALTLPSSHWVAAAEGFAVEADILGWLVPEGDGLLAWLVRRLRRQLLDFAGALVMEPGEVLRSGAVLLASLFRIADYCAATGEAAG